MTGSQAAADADKDVYVSRFGHDSESCGTRGSPCRSIAHGVYRAEWGGRIHIDGTGTEQDPYTCDPPIKHASHPGIYSDKSVIMEGFHSPPHIFCIDGLHFRKSTFNPGSLKITLSRLAFSQTPIVCEDCGYFKIFNCSLRDASTAVRVSAKNISTTVIDILASRFSNNSRCFEFLLLENGSNRNHYVAVTVNDTTFIENGNVVFRLASNSPNSSRSTDVRISCCKIRCHRNLGHFIKIDMNAAVTREIYKDVRLTNNGNPHPTKSLSQKLSSLMEGLYSSRARKTHVEFVNLHCSYNVLIRCLNIQSEESYVGIRNSSFIGLSIKNKSGAALLLVSRLGAFLSISNTDFQRNSARNGGALFVHSAPGTLKLLFTNVNFTSCSATRFGCAILVGKPRLNRSLNQSDANDMEVHLSKVRVQNCFGAYGQCRVVHLMPRSANVTVEESTWIENVQPVRSGLLIDGMGGKVHVTISTSRFINNTFLHRAIEIVALNEHAGSVSIVNSELAGIPIRSKCRLIISPKYTIRLVNFTINCCHFGLVIYPSHPIQNAFPVNIFLDNCVFRDTFYDMIVSLNDPISVNFTIRNTIFAGLKRNPQTKRMSYAVHFLCPPLKKVRLSSVTVLLENVTFDSRPPSSFVFSCQGYKTITIRRSVFRNCFAFYSSKIVKSFYEISTGGITIINKPDNPKQTGCVRSSDRNDTHPLWSYNSRVVFEDTVFEGNVGLTAGAVHITNGDTRFDRCIFRDNFGLRQAGHVYSAYGTGRVELNDCVFSKTRTNITLNETNFLKATFLHSESGGPLKMRNTSMTFFQSHRNAHPIFQISGGGYVDIDGGTILQCSLGNRLSFENSTHFVFSEKNDTVCRINATGIKYSCSLCFPGFYSLQRGSSHGLIVNETFYCLPCPFGATCEQSNVAAKPNFWGYRVSKHPASSLRFIPCPQNYCQRPKLKSQAYNSCYGNRNGTLCGSCAAGFTETLFSTECEKVSKCSNYWVWILAVLSTTGIALYLLIRPPILGFLRRQILWFCKKKDIDITDDSDQASDRSGRDHDFGYLKIASYFYQVFESVVVGHTESALRKVPFIRVVVDGFNFQVITFHRRIGCPFAGLTAVTKELILALPVLITMIEVGLIYCLHCGINLMRRKEKPTLIHYMAVVMETLLLGYERLAETSLKLMHCVTIGSEKRLFLDGNIQCWQWWQYVLLVFNLIFVVCFMFVIFWGSFKLREGSISSRHFLCACFLPLPFLIYWGFKYVFRRREALDPPEVHDDDVLKILHGPFRSPSDNDTGTLYWESVLIGRRFILLTLNAFIEDSMFRMVLISTACVLMTLHHFAKKPYRYQSANVAETTSLLTLAVISIMNLTKATLLSFGVSTEGPSKPYFESFVWFEACAIAIGPLLVSVLVVFAILSQLVRFAVFAVRKVLTWKNYFITFRSIAEDGRPLLDATSVTNWE